MRGLCLSLAALVLAAAGCGTSEEEKAKAAVAERREAALAQLEAIAELDRSNHAIVECGDTLRGVAPDFREVDGGGPNAAWDAMVLRDEVAADLEHYLRNKTSERPPPPKDRVDAVDIHRTFGAGAIAGRKPCLPVHLHGGRAASFGRYAGYLFAPRPLASAQDIRKEFDDLAKVRYLLAVRLTSAVAPTTTGARKDRPGEIGVDYGSLMAEARLYHVAEKRYLGGFAVSATNTPNLRVEYQKYKDSDTAVQETLKLLQKDLEENFIKAFWRMVRSRFPDARVPE